MDSRADVQDEVLKLINIDILYRTFEKTLLSPVFAIWVPVMAIAVGGGGSGGWLYGATIYFVVVLLRWMVLFSSRVWRNGWAGTKGRGEIDWDEEVVVVTGGSSGLGRVLVETLRHKFVRVAVLDVVEMGNVNEEYGDSVRFFRCDVGDPAQLELTARQIVDTLGQPTILVHNAACAHGHSILDLTPALFHKTFATNVFSHFYSLSLFLPHIISRKSGHIVTIASVLGTSSVPQLADYCASKAAAISLHHTLRCELDSRYNCPLVRTTLVCPGRLETKMFSTIKPQNPFFFPVVSPHEVVKLIIQALDSHESRDIFIPLYTRYTWLLKICPTWLEDAVRYLAGVNDSMITFKKVEE